jgi:Predicted integral membrane protein (DUF2269)
VFGRLIKLVHILSVIGFVGGLAASMVVADVADSAPPTALAALRMAIAAVGETLVVPSLVMLVLTGMLLVVARPHLVSARWIWAKAVLSVAIAGIALAVVQPAVTRAAVLAAEAALGSPALQAMGRAFSAEQIGGAVNLLLALVAIALALWRPRLGQSARDSAGEDTPGDDTA